MFWSLETIHFPDVIVTQFLNPRKKKKKNYHGLPGKAEILLMKELYLMKQAYKKDSYL